MEKNKGILQFVAVCMALLLVGMLPAFAQKDSVANLLADTTRTHSQKLAVVPSGGIDTIYMHALPSVMITHKWRPRFAPLSSQEKAEYWRRIRDVKRVLPYVDLVCDLLVETYEYMETLPNARAKRKHLKRFEKELKEQYMPEMKKLTRSQGQLMMKLIDRELGSTPYQIIKAFYGPFKATFYSLFAEIYGGKLNSRYDPKYNRDDALTERILYLYQHHMLN